MCVCRGSIMANSVPILFGTMLFHGVLVLPFVCAWRQDRCGLKDVLCILRASAVTWQLNEAGKHSPIFLILSSQAMHSQPPHMISVVFSEHVSLDDAITRLASILQTSARGQKQDWKHTYTQHTYTVFPLGLLVNTAFWDFETERTANKPHNIQLSKVVIPLKTSCSKVTEPAHTDLWMQAPNIQRS